MRGDGDSGFPSLEGRGLRGGCITQENSLSLLHPGVSQDNFFIAKRFFSTYTETALQSLLKYRYVATVCNSIGDPNMDISELLIFAVKQSASDVHLSAGEPVMLRIHGELRKLEMNALPQDEVHRMIYDILNDQQR
jgi:hypothetical protein